MECHLRSTWLFRTTWMHTFPGDGSVVLESSDVVWCRWMPRSPNLNSMRLFFFFGWRHKIYSVFPESLPELRQWFTAGVPAIIRDSGMSWIIVSTSGVWLGHILDICEVCAKLREFLCQLRSALFWDITRHRVVIVYRRFGTTYQSHLQGLGTPDCWRWDR
jgi:hypothetical protein